MQRKRLRVAGALVLGLSLAAVADMSAAADASNESAGPDTTTGETAGAVAVICAFWL